MIKIQYNIIFYCFYFSYFCGIVGLVVKLRPAEKDVQCDTVGDMIYRLYYLQTVFKRMLLHIANLCQIFVCQYDSIIPEE